MTDRAGASSASLPRSTSCMAAAPVTALVIEAIHITVSAVMSAGWPSTRLPKAPSYVVPPAPVASATRPGTSPRATASRRSRSADAFIVIPPRYLRSTHPHRVSAVDDNRLPGHAVRPAIGDGHPRDVIGASRPP